MKGISKIVTRYFLVQIVLGFLISEKAVSQTPLDLNQALRLARENNLQLQQQKESEKVAVLEESMQKAGLLPTLNLSLTSDYLS